jgi:hypothetical protein
VFAGVVIVFNPVADTTFCLGHGFIGIEIYLLIFDTAPDTLYEYIVREGVSRVRMDEKDRGFKLVLSVLDDVTVMFDDSPARIAGRSRYFPVSTYNPASASRGTIPTVPRGDG